ncbi:hypothetical protein CASFOL_004284 [Castilleja foliolosa]|uniref:Protein kinase domain-containing protein n=1 Tax=Castilleja foliolosa TaxID=1961234 RepID=A0ABD3EAH8_9LAMI
MRKNPRLELVNPRKVAVFYCRFHTQFLSRYLILNASKTGRLQLSDISDDAPNILVFQYCLSLVPISARIPFKPDVAFVSKSSKFYFKNQGKRQEPDSNYERGAIGVVIVIQGRVTLLAYLNEEAKVVHHDVKSSSILLDRKWNASVSDLKACLTIGI